MGAQNGKQWPGVWSHGARIEMQAGNATGHAVADRTPGMGNPQAHHRTQRDDWPTSQ